MNLSGKSHSALPTVVLGAIFVLLTSFGAGCSSEPGDTSVDAGDDAGPGFEVGTDTEVDADAGPPPEHNPCLGLDELEYDGEPAAPGDACGECDDGVLVCDTEETLRCVGASEENACGNCEPLEGEPFHACGPCGDGVWACDDDGGVICLSGSEENACGGCTELDGAPGMSCDLSGGDLGIFSCASPDELRCIAQGENACGGEGDLDAKPGMPCGECNLGVVVCDGTDSTRCEGEEEGLNECGGCAPLVGAPEEACGTCGGGWYCPVDDADFVVCDDVALNACGGCTDLGGAQPGDDCGDGSVWVCDGPNALACPDGPTNACGGDGELEELPGEVCGECGDGQTLCVSPNEVTCVGATELNDCGGCGLLPGEEGDECGAGAQWQCTDDGSMRCEIVDDDPHNGCGGTDPLDELPGTPCGPCELDIWECDGADAVTCSGETSCFEFLSPTVVVDEIEATTATFYGELLTLPPIEVTDHGFCWDTSPAPAGDETNCVSLGAASDEGLFALAAQGLFPSTEYYVQAFAATDDGTQTSDDMAFSTTPASLQFETQPASTQTAGQSFEVAVVLVDQDGQPLQIGGVEVALELNQYQFADGLSQATQVTNPQGLAEFTLTVNKAATGYELTATSSADVLDGVDRTSTPFDVEAAQAYAGNSSIWGEDGAVADGVDEAAVYIELRDEYDNPVVGVVPQFTASGDGNDYLPCSATDADGIAECAMTSTQDEEKTLQITDPVSVMGETIEFVLCGNRDALFGNGTGTEDDPYLICTPEHLNEIGADDVHWDKYFLVTADIDMTGVDYNVIGHGEDVDEDRFRGGFDGGGHSISNLVIDTPDDDYVGLFGIVDQNVVIENVVLEDVDIRGGSRVGALVGLVEWGIVTNSQVTGSVTGNGFSVGGLVGYSNHTTISKSHAAGGVTGYEHVGGLVGYSDYGTIRESYAAVGVQGDHRYVGGLVGYSSNCTISEAQTEGSVTGYGHVGGLVGYSDYGTIRESYAEGYVDGYQDRVGGLVGHSNDGTISESYAQVGVTGHEYVGGLVGYNYGGSSIENAYAAGPVEGNGYVGGLVGWNKEGTFQSPDVVQSYSTGMVMGSSAIGGLIGSNDGFVIASFWDEDTSGMFTSDGGTPLSTNDFDDPSNFDGWDFTTVWTIGTAPDGEQRPVLQWQ